MTKEKVFEVQVTCPHCNDVQIEQVPATDVAKDDVDKICASCNKRYFIGYSIKACAGYYS